MRGSSLRALNACAALWGRLGSGCAEPGQGFGCGDGIRGAELSFVHAAGEISFSRSKSWRCRAGEGVSAPWHPSVPALARRGGEAAAAAAQPALSPAAACGTQPKINLFSLHLGRSLTPGFVKHSNVTCVLGLRPEVKGQERRGCGSAASQAAQPCLLTPGWRHEALYCLQGFFVATNPFSGVRGEQQLCPAKSSSPVSICTRGEGLQGSEVQPLQDPQCSNTHHGALEVPAVPCSSLGDAVVLLLLAPATKRVLSYGLPVSPTSQPGIFVSCRLLRCRSPSAILALQKLHCVSGRTAKRAGQ